MCNWMGRILGEGVKCCFLLGQSALFRVVLTKFEEYKTVTLDTDESLVGLKEPNYRPTICAMFIVNRLLLITVNERVDIGLSQRKPVDPLYLVDFLNKVAGDVGSIGL